MAYTVRAFIAAAAPRLDNAHLIEARPAISTVVPIMSQFG
jgi:hypothetical protein